jgi:hypothetical protein
MIPELTQAQLDQLRSQGERKVYEACRDQLDANWTVVHSVAILKLLSASAPEDGEADFVVFNPDVGIGVVEVKGGAIEYNAIERKWYSTSRAGVKSKIKDAYLQALEQKKEITRTFISHPLWTASSGPKWLVTAHAAFFPDCSPRCKWSLPHVLPEITGWEGNLSTFDEWLSGVFAFWKGDSKAAGPGLLGKRVFDDIYCRALSARPLLANLLEAEESVRVKLTEQQSRLLRSIRMKRQALICGGAGTGKTLLALERARDIALSGRATLLVCYNSPLADHLSKVAAGTPNLQIMTYHALCQSRATAVRGVTGRNLVKEAEALYPNKGHFDCHLPYALAASTEITDWRVDAIVVDEAQDFREDYWIGLLWLLKDSKDSIFYIFYDHNQSLYANTNSLPISDTPFLLTRNCRNTKTIHELTYRYYRGEPTDAPEIPGGAVQEIHAASCRPQAVKLSAEVVRLISEEGVDPEQIAILVATSAKAAYYKELTSHPLPGRVRWAIEVHGQANTVLVDTAPRFKGLESPVVFLWGIDKVDPSVDRELLYVGLSRAKSKLYLVSTPDACTLVKSHLEDLRGNATAVANR